MMALPKLYMYIILLNNIIIFIIPESLIFCFFRGHVNSVSVHPSGRLALSVAKDKTLR